MISLCIPYYDQPSMLAKQAVTWQHYPDSIEVIVVDDGSPNTPADEIIPKDSRAKLYRVVTNIPWNRNGARNLASWVAETPWLLHVDIDHILPGACAWKLVKEALDPATWYRFPRYRIGKADETRRKDGLPADAEHGAIKPHVDSFLCTRELFWRAGGYDEDFSGSLGGSSLFLKHMRAEAGDAKVLPEDIYLNVFTRHVIEDASEPNLPRDRSRYERIRAEKRAAGDPKPDTWLRFPWTRLR